MSEDLFISESNFLFPRKFDRTRFVLRYGVDISLRHVEWALDGWGGYNGQHVSAEGGTEPLDSWSEAYYEATRLLWGQLELQCHPEDRCSSRHRDRPGAG